VILLIIVNDPFRHLWFVLKNVIFRIYGNKYTLLTLIKLLEKFIKTQQKQWNWNMLATQLKNFKNVYLPHMLMSIFIYNIELLLPPAFRPFPLHTYLSLVDNAATLIHDSFPIFYAICLTDKYPPVVNSSLYLSSAEPIQDVSHIILHYCILLCIVHTYYYIREILAAPAKLFCPFTCILFELLEWRQKLDIIIFFSCHKLCNKLW
jgi:hypothetical protein